MLADGLHSPAPAGKISFFTAQRGPSRQEVPPRPRVQRRKTSAASSVQEMRTHFLELEGEGG